MRNFFSLYSQPTRCQHPTASAQKQCPCLLPPIAACAHVRTAISFAEKPLEKQHRKQRTLSFFSPLPLFSSFFPKTLTGPNVLVTPTPYCFRFPLRSVSKDILAVNGKDTSNVTDIKVIGKLIKAATPTLELTFDVAATPNAPARGKVAALPKPRVDASATSASTAAAASKQAEPTPAPEPPKKEEWQPEILGVLPVPRVDPVAACGTAADAQLRASAGQAVLSLEVSCTRITKKFGLPEGFEVELRVRACNCVNVNITPSV